MSDLSGTYSVSKIRKARKIHECSCGTIINKGEEYLSYAPGQRTRVSKCIRCALAVRNYGAPIYDCADVRDALGIEQRRI